MQIHCGRHPFKLVQKEEEFLFLVDLCKYLYIISKTIQTENSFRFKYLHTSFLFLIEILFTAFQSFYEIGKYY